MQALGYERIILKYFLDNPRGVLSVFDKIGEESFSDPIHRGIYRVISNYATAGKHITAFEVANELPVNMQEQAGFTLANILSASSIPNENVLKKISQGLRSEGIRAKVIYEMDNYLTKLRDAPASTIYELVEEIGSGIIGSLPENIETKTYTAGDIINMEFDMGDKIGTPIPELNHVFEGGLELGTISIWTGDAEAGKTHFLTTIAEHVAFSEPVGICSYEFHLRDANRRYVKRANDGIALTEMQRDNIEYAFVELANFATTMSLLARWVEQGKRLILIDSLDRIVYEDKNKKSFEKDEFVLKQLHTFAKANSVHIMVVAQNSKSDLQNKNMGIRGSQQLIHIPEIVAHIHYNRTTQRRFLEVHKNKITNTYPSWEVTFGQLNSIRLDPIDRGQIHKALAEKESGNNYEGNNNTKQPVKEVWYKPTEKKESIDTSGYSSPEKETKKDPFSPQEPMQINLDDEENRKIINMFA